MSYYTEHDYDEPRKPPRLQKSSIGVIVEGNFDRAVKQFLKSTADIVREAKRRSYFHPKPSRAARKRRGKVLEVLRKAREEVPE